MLSRFGLVFCASALAVSGAPTPDFAALAASQYPVAEDIGDHAAVSAQQCLGRAHLGAGRQLAFGQPVASVYFEFGFRSVPFRTAGAEGAFIHLAAQAESAAGGKLRRAERTGIGAVAAADTDILVVQHHAFIGAVEAIDRAHRHAWRVRAVHAGDRNRSFLPDHAVVDRHHATPIDAPGNLVFILARRHAAIAFDAALGIADEFHSSHGLCLLTVLTAACVKR